jgi:multiple sugar transport system ATP-binding protein
MDVTVDVTEELGSEVYVIFTVDAPPVLTEDVKAAADESEDGPTLLLHDEGAEKRTSFTARVDAATQARQGGPLKLSVDTGQFHFFDVQTGAAIGQRQAAAAA